MKNKVDLESIPDLNLFMVCTSLNKNAFKPIPKGFHIRNCRRDELDLWKSMPFDSINAYQENKKYMDKFFSDVYETKSALFFSKCKMVCDIQDRPVGTGFIWKAYNKFPTIQWLKVNKNLEGKGIGRSLLTYLLSDLRDEDFPVYLHTQPSSFIAIKLYADFGFKILIDLKYGSRTNDYKKCLPILEKYMNPKDFKKLEFTTAPTEFINSLRADSNIEF